MDIVQARSAIMGNIGAISGLTDLAIDQTGLIRVIFDDLDDVYGEYCVRSN